MSDTNLEKNTSVTEPYSNGTEAQQALLSAIVLPDHVIIEIEQVAREVRERLLAESTNKVDRQESHSERINRTEP